MGKGPRMGTCPVCGEHTKMTRHHVFPKRFYGGSGPLVLLCRACHWTVEDYIPKHEKMPDDFYQMIVEYVISKGVANG